MSAGRAELALIWRLWGLALGAERWSSAPPPALPPLQILCLPLLHPTPLSSTHIHCYPPRPTHIPTSHTHPTTTPLHTGAMENKSLNIFNSRLVLATPDTATDGDFGRIEGAGLCGCDGSGAARL